MATPVTAHARCGDRSFVDRYLLRELDEAEARAFEEHYFDCPTCAAEIQLAGALVDGARAALGSPARTTEMPAVAGEPPAPDRRPEREAASERDAPPRRPRWRWPLRLAAGAAFPLAAVAGFQALVVVPRLQEELALRDRPRVLAPRTLRPLTRGEVPRLAPAAGDRFVAVQLAVRAPAAAGYRARLLDAAGKPAPAFPELAVPGPPPGDPIQILIPTAGLPPGRYILEVAPQGPGNDAEPDRYLFSLATPGGIP
jgi:hypothetical protein